ncbi:MAG: cytochrome c oxidase subunit 3 [Flavobacteriaceae bacterium]|nr:cytochrome c oxidase subunit 3 [Flavobacteriaceae bacterium]
MDLTQGTPEEKNIRAKKMMLWFGIISLLMAFAGWTSAFIVSSSRKDWLDNLELPSAFFYSTAIIILSSFTYIAALRSRKKDQHSPTTIFLAITLVLGLIFIALQFMGFTQIVDQGYYFTGPTSNITMSYIYLIAMVHVAHVVAGLISLLVVLVKQIRIKYSSANMLGMELGATFWHFLDLLWVYLILFFYFFK